MHRKTAAQESETWKVLGPDSALEGGSGEEKRPEMDGGGPARPFATLRTGSP